MKKITSEQLLKNLKISSNDSKSSSPIQALSQNGINSPLILVTEQVVRAKNTVEWIAKNLIPQKTLQAQKYFGDDFRTKKSAAELVSILNAPSLFSPLQLAVVYKADKVRVAAADEIAKVCVDGNASGLLILVTDKYNSKNPFFSRISKVSTVAEFAPLSESRLQKWLAKEAHSLGIAGIEPKAAGLLIKSLGDDLQLLSAELAKLSLLTEPDKVLESSLVEKFVRFSPEVRSFDLFSAIANKNLVKAEVLQKKIVEQGLHPLQLSSFLSRCIRTLLAMWSKETIIHSKELSNPWFQKNIKRHFNSFTVLQLKAATKEIANLDYLLKGGGVSDYLSLSSSIRKITLRSF